MALWRRQSGDKIKLNDEPATVAKAKELGWEPIGEKVKAPAKATTAKSKTK